MRCGGHKLQDWKILSTYKENFISLKKSNDGTGCHKRLWNLHCLRNTLTKGGTALSIVFLVIVI